jgi:ABC transport system ATP-binding/permease protein
MLDRVSTAVLAIDGEGGWGMFADYSQWEQTRAERTRVTKPEARKDTADAAPPRKKLSYMEAREYETIEQRIQDAESVLVAAQELLQDPSVTADAPALQEAYTKMQQAQAAVDALYQRWAELESKLA